VEIFSSAHDCAEKLFGNRNKFSAVASVCRGEAKKGKYLGKKLIYLENIQNREKE